MANGSGSGSKRQAFKVRAELANKVEDVVKQIVSNVTANLVEDTPVDTGWARSNWVPNLRVRVEQPVGSPDNVTNSRREQGLADVLANFKLSDRFVFISNNVPYIRRLNEGSSEQAPAGFVQNAIAAALRRVR